VAICCCRKCAAPFARATRAPHLGPVARLFFRPLEPFLIGEQSAHRQPARIARTSLQPIWNWILRRGDRLSEAFTRALLDGGAATCDHLIRSFQDQAAARIRSMLDEIKTDDKARRRMIGQIGSPSALEEARDLLTILAGRG